MKTYITVFDYFQIICIWGAGGATPGKFLIGLRVVTCDSSVLVQPNRVLVVPATNVTLSASVLLLMSLFVIFLKMRSLSNISIETSCIVIFL